MIGTVRGTPSRDVSRRVVSAARVQLALSLLVRMLPTRGDTSHIQPFTFRSLHVSSTRTHSVAFSFGFGSIRSLYPDLPFTSHTATLVPSHGTILITDVSFRFLHTSATAHGGSECSSRSSAAAGSTDGSGEWRRFTCCTGSDGSPGAAPPAATSASEARERQRRVSSSGGARAAASNQCRTSAHVRWGARQR